MKRIIILMILAVVAASCVQEVKKHTVTFRLSAEGIAQGSRVAIKGTDKPLSWEQDVVMPYDSTSGYYTATVTFYTGYLFTEYKYTADGVYELEGQENREVIFNESGNTLVSDVFNKR